MKQKFPKGKFSASVNNESTIEAVGTKDEFVEFEKCMKLNGHVVDLQSRGQ